MRFYARQHRHYCPPRPARTIGKALAPILQ
jgi:hypothetical protein